MVLYLVIASLSWNGDGILRFEPFFFYHLQHLVLGCQVYWFIFSRAERPDFGLSGASVTQYVFFVISPYNG